MIYEWQQKQWQQLWQSETANRLGHALLLSGNKGLGKFEFAIAFVQSMLCQDRDHLNKACQKCHSCRLVETALHPNLMIITPEKEQGEIKIDQIREAMDFIYQSPLQGKYTFLIINPAEALNSNATNALLKTLEEPPPHALIFLISHHMGQLFATVLSRCQKIIFNPPTLEQAKKWLEKNPIEHEIEKEVLLQLTKDSPLTAKFVGSELEIRKHFFNLLLDIKTKKSDPFTAAQSLNDYSALIILDFFYYWLMDCLRLYFSENNLGLIHNLDFKENLLSLVSKINPKDYIHTIKEISRLRKMLVRGANLNKQLLFEFIDIEMPALTPVDNGKLKEKRKSIFERRGNTENPQLIIPLINDVDTPTSPTSPATLPSKKYKPRKHKTLSTTKAKKAYRIYFYITLFAFAVGTSGAVTNPVTFYGTQLNNLLNFLSTIDKLKTNPLIRKSEYFKYVINLSPIFTYTLTAFLVSIALIKGSEFYRRMMAPEAGFKEEWRLYKETVRDVINCLVESREQKKYNKGHLAEYLSFVYVYKDTIAFSYTLEKQISDDFKSDIELADLSLKSIHHLLLLKRNEPLNQYEKNITKGLFLLSGLLYAKNFSIVYRFKRFKRNENFSSLHGNTFYHKKREQVRDHTAGWKGLLEALEAALEKLNYKISETFKRNINSPSTSSISFFKNGSNNFLEDEEKIYIDLLKADPIFKDIYTHQNQINDGERLTSKYYSPLNNSCEMIITEKFIDEQLSKYNLSLNQIEQIVAKSDQREVEQTSRFSFSFRR